MKLLTILTMGMAWLTTSTALGQGIDRTELFSELNGIRIDRSCNAEEAKKLFYFRKGPKTRTSYQIEKDVLSGIQEVFPDQSFFDVSGLGLLAKLDQGGSDQYVDMIEASLQAVNEPGLYIHADFSNLDGSEMLEIQAWTLENRGGSLEQTCLKRTILFADQDPDLNTVTENNGIIIQGDVSNTGSGNVDISNTNFEVDKDASEIRTLEQAHLLLTVAPDIKRAAKLIPVRIAYQLTHKQLTEIAQHGVSTSNAGKAGGGEIAFKDGQYNYFYKDELLDTERWSLSVDRDVTQLGYSELQSLVSSDIGSGTYIDIDQIGIRLGLDSFRAIADKSIEDNEDLHFDNSDIRCNPATEFAFYLDYFLLECAVENARIGTVYIFRGRGLHDLTSMSFSNALDAMMKSHYIPLELSIHHLGSPCLWQSEANDREVDQYEDCVSDPKESWVPWNFNDSSKPPDKLPTISKYRIYNFLANRYLLSDNTSHADPAFHRVMRTYNNFAKLYKNDGTIGYLGRTISVESAIANKLLPRELGYDLAYYNPVDIEFTELSDHSGTISFQVAQTLRSECMRVERQVKFELVIEYDVEHMYVLSETASNLNSKEFAMCE